MYNLCRYARFSHAPVSTISMTKRSGTSKDCEGEILATITRMLVSYDAIKH